MSGATSNTSISSLIQQCNFLEEQSAQALVKSFRATTGQFKIADTTVNNSATLVTDSEFSFPVKANFRYIVSADLMFNVWAGAGPLGNLKLQFNLPGHTTNMAFDGQAVYTISGSAATVQMLGNAANSPYASPQVASIQAFNTTVVSANTATAAYSANYTMYGLLVPAVDDVLTIQIAQAAASATGSTILLRSSVMNCLCLAQSRRAPNVV